MDLKNKTKIINLKSLTIIPILIVFVSLATLGAVTYKVGRTLVLNNTKDFGTRIANEFSNQIENNSASMDVIDSIIEDKIIVVGKAVILSEKNINNERLRELASKLNVFEINLFSREGEILNSTIDEYVGAKVFEGHPAYFFMNSGFDAWVEKDIRKDTESFRFLRYGYVRRNDGSFIQVGILSEQIYQLKEKFQYQNQLNRLKNDKNIIYAVYYDKNLNEMARISNQIHVNYGNKDNVLINALNRRISTIEIYDPEIKIRVMQVTVPVKKGDTIQGVLTIGISMNEIYKKLSDYFLITIILDLILCFIIIYILAQKIKNPLENLSDDIEKIDLEENIEYRLPIQKNDDFSGLKSVINNILNKISASFSEIKESKEELTAANEELISTIEQLTAAEEELRAQYDEIQNYTQKLEELQQKYDLAIKASNSGVWEFDLTSKKLHISENIDEIVGFKIRGENTLKKLFDMVIEPEDKKILIQDYYKYVQKKDDKIHTQIRIIDKSGNIRWLLVTGKAIESIDGKSTKLFGIFFETTLLKQKEQEIEKLAYYDHLTELPNRAVFVEELSHELNNKKSGAVMLFDIDNFKNINDIMGHIYGDKLLKHVAEVFNTLTDKNIKFYRFGGDEFLILIKNADDESTIEKYAKKILNTFKQEISEKSPEFNITASIGISVFPKDGFTIEDLLMKADTAMYRAKFMGKNTFIFFHDEMTVKLRENIEIENQLVKAINQDGFALYYQPVVDAKTKNIVSYEALLRLKDSNLSPAKFIPIAEETNLIIPIGKWVIEEAVKQIKRCANLGKEIPIAINVSPKQLKDSMFVFTVQKAIEEYQIDPRLIEIEITENIMIENKAEALNVLNELRKLGITIALDDFGVGYSSLNYLTYLPINKVKLDKSLNDKFLNANDSKVIEGLIMLFKSLKVKVVAEGIETEEQYNILKHIGCDYIQGFYVGRPRADF
ncbi:Phytochrome-like protein cph2 [Caloramator mitchellensis]|uniref:Phytochrome-like protein cph2 n=1 Tax=Caloramator mitchellensis TaxID=908809 RepID=A0A0R3JS34_CALMK|nr:EAL domain-containing protein [Caloramator mitchellensis]KRQ86281.1 Phytochrome-like protein cph2 [Caloramator mitchellensis]